MNILCFCCKSYHSRLENGSKLLSKNGNVDSYYSGRSEIDPSDFIITNKCGGIYGRISGEINGQQFIIQNCKCSYPGLEDHFAASGLSIFNCNWYDIYDFTPDENTDAVHISLLKTTDSIDNHVLTPQKALEHELENSKLENGDDSMSLLQPLMSIPLSFSTDNSVVPYTIGNKLLNTILSQSNNQIIEKQFNKSALITIFPHESAIQSAKIICDYLRKTNSCTIVQTSCSQFSEHEIEQIFKCNSKVFRSGNVITIEITGTSNTLDTLSEEIMSKTNITVSSKLYIQITTDSLETTRRINLLNGLHRMHMNA
ncbi:unnamed protein product [Schistosoma rodhaini]|nr:unnamed protein product [Schistosoma rodhaini]